MKLTFKENIFTCEGENLSLARNAGFAFAGKWCYTKDCRIAARLRDYADKDAKNEIDRLLIHHAPWAGAIPVPEGLALKEFQIAPIKFALSRNRSYLACDPGLGKGVMAVAIMNALNAASKKFVGIYICPPFLTRTVEEEFHKWRTFKGQITRHDQFYLFGDMVIIPDSLLSRDEMRAEISWYCKYSKAQGKEVVGFIDEAQRYGHEDAQRTESLLCDAKKGKAQVSPPLVSFFDRTIYLSGTPIDNGAPKKLFPILNRSAPETIGFRNYYEYGEHYCAGFKEKIFDGSEKWNFDGASNMEELQENIKGTFMYRLRKDVLNLPPRLEELLIVDHDMKGKALALDKELLTQFSPEDVTEARFLKRLGKGSDCDLNLATYRRLLGIEKVGFANTFIRDVMQETNSSILVFAYHREVIAALEAMLSKYNPLVVTGGMPQGAAFERAAKFQKDKSHRLMILQNEAGGVGLTLTKADRVLLVEPAWSDSANAQMIDRAHRIGQKDSVFAQYMVFRNSMDKRVIEANLRKKEVSSFI